MDHELIRAVVLAHALPAAFESACLLRCTDTAAGQRRTGFPAPAEPFPALAEFDQAAAADRFSALLTGLGYHAYREERTGGGRRQYRVQRVLVPHEEHAAAARMTVTAWRQGSRALLSTDPLGASSPRNAQRTALAYAAWRAALLAGGRRVRGENLWVRLAHPELIALLVRASRLLSVPVEVNRRPGCMLVTVPASVAHRLQASELHAVC